MYLDDGAVAGVDRHLDPHQRPQSVGIGQGFPLHVIPGQTKFIIN